MGARAPRGRRMYRRLAAHTAGRCSPLCAGACVSAAACGGRWAVWCGTGCCRARAYRCRADEANDLGNGGKQSVTDIVVWSRCLSPRRHCWSVCTVIARSVATRQSRAHLVRDCRVAALLAMTRGVVVAAEPTRTWLIYTTMIKPIGGSKHGEYAGDIRSAQACDRCRRCARRRCRGGDP